MAVGGHSISEERGVLRRDRERKHARKWQIVSFPKEIVTKAAEFFHQVNANGNVIRSEILGAVKMKCYLSGMPELRLGLNDKVMFESTGRSESLPLRLAIVSFFDLIPLQSCSWQGN